MTTLEHKLEQQIHAADWKSVWLPVFSFVVAWFVIWATLGRPWNLDAAGIAGAAALVPFILLVHFNPFGGKEAERELRKTIEDNLPEMESVMRRHPGWWDKLQFYFPSASRISAKA
jgi:hypothetical protein